MQNILRSRARNYSSIQERTNSITIGGLAQDDSHDLGHNVQTLDYKAVCSVVLIAEVNERGKESPIAIAFINQNSSGAILTLYQLGEVE